MLVFNAITSIFLIESCQDDRKMRNGGKTEDLVKKEKPRVKKEEPRLLQLLRVLVHLLVRCDGALHLKFQAPTHAMVNLKSYSSTKSFTISRPFFIALVVRRAYS
jgi:hypothetical protein